MEVQLSNYARSLSRDVQKRYIEKIIILNSCDPYLLTKDDSVLWSNNLDSVPEVTYPDIFHYLVITKSAYTPEEFKAFKSLEAYNYFASGWITNTKWVGINTVVLVVSEVTHSQRLNEAKLLPWLILKLSGEVVAAHCNCMAGLGECCSHVGTVLFYLQYACLKKLDSTKSVTDVSAYWVGTSNQHFGYQKINAIDFSHPKKIGREHFHTKKTKDDYNKKLPTTLNDNQCLHSFLSKLEKVNGNAAILKVIPPFNLKFKIDLFPKSFVRLYKDEYALLNKEDLVAIGVKHDFSLTKHDCDTIENNTKQQSESKEWFLYRSGRITASKIQEVCAVKTCSSNISLIRSICYPLDSTFKNEAIKWGITHESDAKTLYYENVKQEHINFTITDSGLLINPCFPFIGASPDGVIKCDCCGSGVLEIKCPYSLTQGKNIENLDCLSNGKLKNTHKYFYQIQTQMLVGGYKYGDFVIWSPNNFYMERIIIDDILCNEIVQKSNWFFYESILPELLGRYFTNYKHRTVPTEKETVVPKNCLYKYCICKEDKGGKMIMCTNEGCPNLWYHYTCLGIRRIPLTKKWKCSSCK